MTIIAISHQIGSGGREIGKLVADKLGVSYIDREIVEGVAQRLGISEADATQMDEKAEHLADQIFAGFRLQVAGYAAQINPGDMVDIPTYQEATQGVLATVASYPSVVIAGHGANFFLAKRTALFSVFIYAAAANRIERLKKRAIISQEEAAKELHVSDGERAHYIKTLYHANWRDPDHYHLLINTDKISLETAANLIIKVVKA